MRYDYNTVRIGLGKVDYINFDQRNVHIWASRTTEDDEEHRALHLVAGDYVFVSHAIILWLKQG